MSQDNARALAARVLRRVDRDQAYASLVLATELSKSPLDTRDKGLATELVYGVLRHRSRLDDALKAQSKKKLRTNAAVLDVLRIAAYQILELDRVPHHAAVNEAVIQTRRISGPRVAGFANGLLRSLCRSEALDDKGDKENDGEGASMATLLRLHSMPQWIASELAKRLAPQELLSCLAAFNSPAETVVRARENADDVARELSDERSGVHVTRHPWQPSALRIKSGGDPSGWSAWQRGALVVQDAAAQLVGALIEPDASRVLDLCAGVGGKSFHAADRAQGARIDAVDRSPQKLALLSESAAHLGLRAITTHAADVLSDELRGLDDAYDAVIVDAPCTGLGVLRRHPEIKWAKDVRDPHAFAAIQEKLLARAKDYVRVGGHLIYAVCTVTEAEGPSVVANFLKLAPEFSVDMPEESETSPQWATLLGPSGAAEIWPHRHEADGFFVVRFCRNS